MEPARAMRSGTVTLWNKVERYVVDDYDFRNATYHGNVDILSDPPGEDDSKSYMFGKGDR